MRRLLTLAVAAIVVRAGWRNRPCIACLLAGKGWTRHDYNPAGPGPYNV